jgi:hypothetical protein
MTLPARQQRILDGMAVSLQERDPRLASLFSIFTRLTRQEPMPRAEEMPPGRPAVRRARSGRPEPRGRRRPERSAAWLRAIVIPVALAAVAAVLFLSLMTGSTRGCPARLTRTSAQLASWASGCATARTAQPAQR